VKTRSVFDATEATFERDVLERSREVPVVVDFWADWCAPCRVLGPILERLATEAGGDWVLAEVDVDSNPALAAAFGIQGIPAVRAFKDGRMVSEFTGALPEPQVRAWLAQLGPSAGDKAVEEGAVLERDDDLEGAARAYRRALDLEPGHTSATSALARVELGLRVVGLDERSLRSRVDAEPSEVSAVTALADVEFSSGRIEDALGRLVDLVRVTSGDDRERARLHLLGLLNILPADDSRVLSARRALSLALF
jgi:putative thioredoxin